MPIEEITSYLYHRGEVIDKKRVNYIDVVIDPTSSECQIFFMGLFCNDFKSALIGFFEG